MSNGRKWLVKYGITTAAAGLATLGVLSLQGYWEATATVDKYRILANGFTVPGVLLIMVAALIWVSSEGFFDSLAYAFTRVGGMLIPFFKKGREHQSYYDYKMSRRDKRAHGYSFLFFVGLVFVAVAVVFVVLHESVYVPMV